MIHAAVCIEGRRDPIADCIQQRLATLESKIACGCHFIELSVLNSTFYVCSWFKPSSLKAAVFFTAYEPFGQFEILIGVII
jgi:hypothetical protein